jgi:major membrane immunogen (membrane-anchored lipoprotein)
LKSSKLVFVFGIIALIAFAGLSACSSDDDDSATKLDPIPGNPTGTGTASANGFAATPAPEYEMEHPGEGPGRPVTVTVTVAEGYITDVVITGLDESAGIGLEAIARAPAIIKAKNTFNVDIMSGATYTITAIKAAGNEALGNL